MRYVVTELEGYSASRRSGLGLSCHVIDTACNRRLVASFRTEDTGGGRRFERTRRYARECCDELNAASRSPTCLVCLQSCRSPVSVQRC